ncbi:hypothetical protein [Burkholderia cenocepacia]|uniref:hypothetical protein n=1 Tax=Burkholderia cenocepacia TaxID=95486 RepID=UPI00076152D9|nr:hypothetical protein [Burkholderia cenocepacia]KWU24783.1 hypothetical protein AS149_32065 [Burkholderia cenocepacia]
MDADLTGLVGLNILTVELARESDGSLMVTLERARRRGHPDRWAVRKFGSALSVDGSFEYEPMPSSRDDAFYARCRFDTVANALEAWRLHVALEKPFYDEYRIECFGLAV